MTGRVMGGKDNDRDRHCDGWTEQRTMTETDTVMGGKDNDRDRHCDRQSGACQV